MDTAYYRDDTVTLYAGDATATLAGLEEKSVDCVVTSPPCWGLRDCGTGTWVGGDPGCAHLAVARRGSGVSRRCGRCGAQREDDQQGLELTSQDYVDRLRDVFGELHRVLADTGSVWLNLGDSYAAGPRGRARDAMRASASGRDVAATLREPSRWMGAACTRPLRRESLVGMPWRVAFALQADGWILRNAIVWHTPNAIPESVCGRLPNRYELLFLLTKQRKYFFDLDSVRAPLVHPEAAVKGAVGGGTSAHRWGQSAHGTRRDPGLRGKNPGDVWSVGARLSREAYVNAVPIEIPLRCIAAGSPEGGFVLDPFSGTATTGLAARRLGRSYVGIDSDPALHDLGLSRLGLTIDEPKSAA